MAFVNGTDIGPGHDAVYDARPLAPDVMPPVTLQTKHGWGTPALFPSVDSPDLINVRLPPFNATGDGYTDDWQVTRALTWLLSLMCCMVVNILA